MAAESRGTDIGTASTWRGAAYAQAQNCIETEQYKTNRRNEERERTSCAVGTAEDDLERERGDSNETDCVDNARRTAGRIEGNNCPDEMHQTENIRWNCDGQDQLPAEEITRATACMVRATMKPVNSGDRKEKKKIKRKGGKEI
ncbi:uncharacterized protein LOC105663233 isoform X1 [Megachile rotundata]|uniref:uncharacterized protein LOC105663233 isoform X1 n=1 Tax=Megachile rotundata TaxID=143995 RepID=UPI0006153B88|nr:PREDICTED: uncharacterized protein LOC105663233 isoform X2 [Megachile rotundata]